MSLNGLWAPEIVEAYNGALGEGGGWFVAHSACPNINASLMKTFSCRLLVKYQSRDEVGLLGRGIGGLGDLQAAINAYEEQSPLFGFIQYRRRKVVLKYVPEGTSRLLQGRHLRDCKLRHPRSCLLSN